MLQHYSYCKKKKIDINICKTLKKQLVDLSLGQYYSFLQLANIQKSIQAFNQDTCNNFHCVPNVLGSFTVYLKSQIRLYCFIYICSL